jgi:tRNA threonylcarbamoyladenosine biosynthesis protein TsaE
MTTLKMINDINILSESVEQTIELGRKIGGKLKGGEVISLIGLLGSGKTHLVKGIAAGAGARDAHQVNSPTFVLINEYSGTLEVFHIDAYRIESIEEFERLGVYDLIGPGSVVLIEWADKVKEALRGIDCIEIKLAHKGVNKRQIQILNMNG